ncbi:MAG TPA: hypothetical protein VKA21_05795 [Candidatus Binatia bacterium]|nr:hypothetical protein [Candidatus Binatia bacterium]
MIHEENGFRYAVATADFGDAIVRVLSESFCREPMGAMLGISAQDLLPLVARFVPECTTNGLSVIAVPADDPATLAGVFISRDFKSPLPDGILDDFSWFHPIGEALGTVDEAYERQRPGLTPGKAVDLWMVGTDRRFVRRGIANVLFRMGVELARRNGFERCVTECTGAYSQAAARKAGFAERARLAYRDFRFDGRPIFAAIEPPHTHLILYEKEL